MSTLGDRMNPGPVGSVIVSPPFGTPVKLPKGWTTGETDKPGQDGSEVDAKAGGDQPVAESEDPDVLKAAR